MKFYLALVFSIAALASFEAVGQTYTYVVDTTFNPQDKGNGSDDYLQLETDYQGFNGYAGTNTSLFLGDGNIVLTNFRNDTILLYRNKTMPFLTRLTPATAPAPGYASWLVPALRDPNYINRYFVARTNRNFSNGKRTVVSDHRPAPNGMHPMRGIRADGTEDSAISNIAIPGNTDREVDHGYLPTGELYLTYQVDTLGERRNYALIFPPSDSGLPITVSAPVGGFQQVSPTQWDRDEQGRIRQLQFFNTAAWPGGVMRLHTYEPTTAYEQDMVFLEAEGSNLTIDATVYKNARLFPVANGKFLVAYTRHSTPNRLAAAGPNAIVVSRYNYEGTFDNTFATITIPLAELDSIHKTDVIIDIAQYPDGSGMLLTAHREEYYWTPNFHERDFWLTRKYMTDGHPFPGADFSFVTTQKATFCDIGPEGQALFLARTAPTFEGYWDFPAPNGYELVLADSLGGKLPVAILSGGFNGAVNSMALRQGTSSILAGGRFSQLNDKRIGAVTRFDGATGQLDTATRYDGSIPEEVYYQKDGTSFAMGSRGETYNYIQPTGLQLRAITRRLHTDLSIDRSGPAVIEGVPLADDSFASFMLDTLHRFDYGFFLRHYTPAGVLAQGPMQLGNHLSFSRSGSIVPLRDTTFLFGWGQVSDFSLEQYNPDLSYRAARANFNGIYAMGTDGSVLYRNLYPLGTDTLRRLKPDLTPDTNFHGRVNAVPVASLQDGSALVLYNPTTAYDWDSTLIRLLPNGNVDPNFKPIHFPGNVNPKSLSTEDGQYVYLYGSFLGTFGGKPSSRVMRLTRKMLLPTSVATPARQPLRLVPNPARNHVRVEAIGARQASLYALDGRLIQSEILVDGNGRFALNGLPKGMYLVKAGSMVERLVVE